MEEDTVNLMDYINIFYKRKVFIIVITLVSTVIGVVVALKLPVKYRADATIKIGKSTSTRLDTVLIPIEVTADLAEIIPIKYALRNKEFSGFHLGAEKIGETTMVRVFLQGPDRRTESVLKKMVIKRLLDDHLKIAETSILPYTLQVNKLESKVEALRRKIAESQVSLKKEEVDVQKQIERFASSTEDVKRLGSETSLLTVLSQRLISDKSDLERKQEWLSRIDHKLFIYQSFIDNAKGHRTVLVGKVNNVAIKPKRRQKVIYFGFIGLVASLLLSFFKEYMVGNTKGREGDSA